MKKLIIISILIAGFYCLNAQTINWQSVDKTQKNLAYLNIGYDFGMTTQVGYGHKLTTSIPILLTADYSMPMGKTLLDDYKVRLGGQVIAFEKNNFIASARVNLLFRRNQTSFVRMASFGSEAAASLGYYKPSWSAAAELGFDKSVLTNLKHGDIMQDNFPGITNGWFLPSGGHFYYGIAGSKSLGNNLDLSLRLGATNAQSDDQNALLPFYGQLGLVWKFSPKS